jgi:hypothetical protein
MSPDWRPDPIDRARLNPDGGAIAIGHPVGASGTRLVLHLALSLKTLGEGRGVASLCVGGGQGGAMLIERTRDMPGGPRPGETRANGDADREAIGDGGAP